MSNACLYTLPVELLHRIIDYLDTETVFLSFRNVCQNFHAVVNSYGRHQLDFRWIPKSVFYRIRRLVQPDQITALILFNDDTMPNQTELFLSLFDLSLFTRLRFVSLSQIKMADVVQYIDHINKLSLVSFSVDSAVILSRSEQIDARILTLCKLQHLSLTGSSSPTFIFNALTSFPLLKTFAFDGLVVSSQGDKLPPSINNQSKLKSLSLNFHYSDIQEITLILQYIPSLINLKLVGNPIKAEHMWTGDWWIDFIQVYLPELKTFKFFFERNMQSSSPQNAIEFIISPFRTPFWWNKQWHITCDYYKDTHDLKLYTIPICKTVLVYRDTPNKISSSNVNNQTSLIMNDTSSLILRSIVPIAEADSQVCSSFFSCNGPLFPRVSKLQFLLTSDFSDDTLHYLSRLVHFSHLDSLSIVFDLNVQSLQQNQIHVECLLERTSNLRKIALRSNRPEHFIECFKIICPMINSRIINVKVDLISIDTFEYVFQRFQNCPSLTIQFHSYSDSEWEKFLQRLKLENIDFFVRYVISKEVVCFGKEISTNK